MAFDPNKIPEGLREAYREKRCGFLVGAGASMGAGLPSWQKLLLDMNASALKHRLITDEKSREYASLAKDTSKFLMVAAALKEDFGSRFDEFITETFIRPRPKPTDLHRAFVKADRLQFVLTTNYDTLIEQAYRGNGQDDVLVCTFADTGEMQRRLSKREFFILKAHGDAYKVGNGIILTEIDYRDILYRQRAYQSMLAAMFTMFTVVFVGASMTDPEIKLILGYIADAFAPISGPSHFALMAEEDTTETERQRWRKDMKVQVIPISKADDYAELTQFVETLHTTA
jgi:hypothetical protein